MMVQRITVLFFLCLFACSDDPELSLPHQSDLDAGGKSDLVEVSDALAQDEGLERGDMGGDMAGDMAGEDARPPLDLGVVMDLAQGDGGDQVEMGIPKGIGQLSGACQVLGQMEVLAPTPLFLTNTLDFGEMPFSDSDKDRLTPGGRVLLETENAGGSSELSEVFSFEVLARCEEATLLKTETMVDYDPKKPGPITDILVKVEGFNVGVSVVRAFIFMDDSGAFPEEEATRILVKKLDAILASSARVVGEDTWVKQILHIISADPQYVPVFEETWRGLPAETKADTIVLMTSTDGADLFLYR